MVIHRMWIGDENRRQPGTGHLGERRAARSGDDHVTVSVVRHQILEEWLDDRIDTQPLIRSTNVVHVSLASLVNDAPAIQKLTCILSNAQNSLIDRMGPLTPAQHK